MLLLLISCNEQEVTIDPIAFPRIAGTYTMKYTPVKDWDVNQRNRIESLQIDLDSSYHWELMRPLGGFQVMPEDGKINISRDTLYLESGKRFVLIDGELFTTNNVHPEWNLVPWKKQK